MTDLSTTYLGLKLHSPLVVSASPLSRDIDGICRLEDAGAAAVVLYSLFEEQLRQEEMDLEYHLNAGTESFPESLTYFPQPSEFHTGPEGYLNHLRKAKAAVKIPIIASLNGCTLGGWTKFAGEVERAGADAIECNLYSIPTDPRRTAADVENRYLHIVRAVKDTVTIPVAVKLSPFFSNLSNFARRLDDAGADALVLFNRFYQPDIDLEELEIRPNVLLSTQQALRLPLTWIGILHGPRGLSRNWRSAWRRGRREAADGRSERNHALLVAHPQWGQPSAPRRARTARLDGRARVRIRGANARQHEPVALPGSQRL
jgi:dihydroorotate dehydrogenase (fumarate)